MDIYIILALFLIKNILDYKFPIRLNFLTIEKGKRNLCFSITSKTFFKGICSISLSPRFFFFSSVVNKNIFIFFFILSISSKFYWCIITSDNNSNSVSICIQHFKIYKRISSIFSSRCSIKISC